ncbi:MAG: transporter ATP-binding protein, partial [Rhizobacter sp.]|nr:transporter ATP-binding protein [Rhizobacter sp.]
TLHFLCTPEGGGKCVVLSTHVMQEAQRLCDKVVVMAHGRSVAEGTVAELCERTGQADFEDAFVRLAFGGTAGETTGEMANTLLDTP